MSANGIIISTQTPIETGRFPRSGGTAFGLNLVTGLPVILMHRNGKAKPDESTLLSKIDHNGLIFITGHGGDQANDLSGIYKSSSHFGGDEAFHFKWGIDKYVQLLIDNLDMSKLKKQANTDLEKSDAPVQPHLNIVLWVCQGARSDYSSIAAKMAKLFAVHGVDVSILANQDNTNRFDGKFYDGKMLFHHDNDKIRIFHCKNNMLTIHPVPTQEPIYVNDKGIVGFHTTSLVSSVRTDSSFDLAELAKQSKRTDLIYLENKSNLKTLLTNNPNAIVIKTSSAQEFNENKDSYLFTLSIRKPNGSIISQRNRITVDGEIVAVNYMTNDNIGEKFNHIDDAINCFVEAERKSEEKEEKLKEVAQKANRGSGILNFFEQQTNELQLSIHTETPHDESRSSAVSESEQTLQHSTSSLLDNRMSKGAPKSQENHTNKCFISSFIFALFNFNTFIAILVAAISRLQAAIVGGLSILFDKSKKEANTPDLVSDSLLEIEHCQAKG